MLGAAAVIGTKAEPWLLTAVAGEHRPTGGRQPSGSREDGIADRRRDTDPSRREHFRHEEGIAPGATVQLDRIEAATRRENANGGLGQRRECHPADGGSRR